jgi:tetratricopeptide (TPR) repeat protein
MMRLLICLLLALPLTAQEGLAARLQGAPRLSRAALEILRSDLARCPESPRKAYWQALVDYQLVWKLRGGDPDGAKALLEGAITCLESSQDPDGKALLGACLDLMIGFNRARAFLLAPRAARLIQEALRAAPRNPRVKVFWGIHCVFIPALFGGGSSRAVAVLTEAIQEAEAEADPGDPLTPRWGRIEAMAWLAEALADDGRKVEARNMVERAIALDPQYPFARALQKELR